MQTKSTITVFRRYVTYPIGYGFPAGVIDTNLSFTANLEGDWVFTATPISGTDTVGDPGTAFYSSMTFGVGLIDRTPNEDGSSGGASLNTGREKQIIIQALCHDEVLLVLVALLKVLIQGVRYDSEDNVMDSLVV